MFEKMAIPIIHPLKYHIHPYSPFSMMWMTDNQLLLGVSLQFKWELGQIPF